MQDVEVKTDEPVVKLGKKFHLVVIHGPKQKAERGRVVGLFSKKKKAKAYAKQLNKITPTASVLKWRVNEKAQ